jgi:hypothetical protein
MLNLKLLFEKSSKVAWIIYLTQNFRLAFDIKFFAYFIFNALDSHNLISYNGKYGLRFYIIR